MGYWWCILNPRIKDGIGVYINTEPKDQGWYRCIYSEPKDQGGLVYSESKDQGLKRGGGVDFQQFSTSFLTDNPPGGTEEG